MHQASFEFKVNRTYLSIELNSFFQLKVRYLFFYFSFIKINICRSIEIIWFVDRRMLIFSMQHYSVFSDCIYIYTWIRKYKFIYCASSTAPFNCCDGGTKWSGRTFGNSLPSNLMFMRCIAKANSSISKKPSPSQSDNFHILLKTEFGNFDFWSSDFAAAIQEIHFFLLSSDQRVVYM